MLQKVSFVVQKYMAVTHLLEVAFVCDLTQ